MGAKGVTRRQQPRAITRVEVFVVICILGVLAALFLPSSDTQTRWNIKRRIAEWDRDRPPVAKPNASLLASDILLEGKWEVHRHLQSSAIEISRNPPWQYQIAFSTSGCLGGLTLERTGTYVDGTLSLDKPVGEYLPLTYDRLYAVRIEGTDYLLPEASVEQFEAGLSADKRSIMDSRILEMWVFRREK